jgi:hypothetical protein
MFLIYKLILIKIFKNYKPAEEGPSEYQSIPLNKIEDFGVHCKQLVGKLYFNYGTINELTH